MEAHLSRATAASRGEKKESGATSVVGTLSHSHVIIVAGSFPLRDEAFKAHVSNEVAMEAVLFDAQTVLLFSKINLTSYSYIIATSTLVTSASE